MEVRNQLDALHAAAMVGVAFCEWLKDFPVQCMRVEDDPKHLKESRHGLCW